MTAAAGSDVIAAAVRARSRAYCPYSRYPVGAAVVTGSGKIFSGCNVENASYGLSMCAERVAVYQAVAAGATSFRAVAVAGANASPCGACRQVLSEFCDADTPVFLIDTDGVPAHKTVSRTSVARLLPLPFSLKRSPRRS